ncbi:hypothetical protein Unana1_02626 [Umbelopsis nana]
MGQGLTANTLLLSRLWHTHFDTDEYVYVQKIGYASHENVKEHFACPSCLSHCADLDDLKRHLQNPHLQQPTPTETNTQQEVGHPPQKRQREATVGIATGSKRMITFSSTAYFYESNMPKFPQQVIDTLRPIVSINTVSAQRSTLDTLKMFQRMHAFLLTALEQELEMLPSWLWARKHCDLVPQEKQLWSMAKFYLTAFADNCTSTNTAPLTDYELRRVVPIFQTFGNQTGLLSFDWCEWERKHHAVAEMDHALWEKGRPRFADGLGYDWSGEERLIMKASGGQHHEDVQQTIDDSIKQISSMILMLKGLGNSHLNASFNTVMKTNVFGIQSIKTSIILSEIQVDEHGKFVYKEVRTAEIPTTYAQRNKWLRIFELLAYLLVGLEEQVANLKTLDDEQDGKMDVLPEETIRMMLYPAT